MNLERGLKFGVEAWSDWNLKATRPNLMHVPGPWTNSSVLFGR